jgi:hypothetical protein
MNPITGWLLAGTAAGVGWLLYGWQGLLFAITLVVFWLILQFSRSVRALKNAGEAPVGHVGSAVMLHSRLNRGMTLLQVLGLTKSLGQRIAETPETWAWADAAGNSVELVFENAKLARWTLTRPEEPAAVSPDVPPNP